jgi:periplasmic copper chaperone A
MELPMILTRTLALGALFVIALQPPQAVAHEQTIGALKVAHAWVRATTASEKVTLGYAIEIANTGKTADRLLGASLEAAGEGELRSVNLDTGSPKATPIAGGLVIEPGKSIALAPGSVHLHFSPVKSPLAAGSIAKGMLWFEKAGKVAVDFMVEPAELAAIDMPALGSDIKPAAGEKKTGHHHGH